MQKILGANLPQQKEARFCIWKVGKISSGVSSQQVSKQDCLKQSVLTYDIVDGSWCPSAVVPLQQNASCELSW